MVKGRNTSVISIRVPDTIVEKLKKKARNARKTTTELLLPVIYGYAEYGCYPTTERMRNLMELICNNTADEYEYYEDDEDEVDLQDFEDNKVMAGNKGVKYPGTPRNAPCPCGSGKKYKRCCGA